MIAALALGYCLTCRSYASSDPPDTTGLPVTDGVIVRLDASLTNTIVAAEGQLGDGDKISAWGPFVQSNSNKQPMWKADVTEMGSRPAVLFMSSLNTVMAMPSLLLEEDITLFIVSQNYTQNLNPDSYHRAVLAADNNPYRADGNGYGFGYVRGDWPDFNISLGSSTEEEKLSASYGVTYDNLARIYTFRRDGTSAAGSQLYERKICQRSNTLLSTRIFSRASDFHTGYYLGAEPSISARHYDGYVSELIIYNRTLTDTELQQVNDYLYEKYLLPQDCSDPGMTYLPADLNLDRCVNLLDISIFASAWMNESIPESDFNFTDLRCYEVYEPNVTKSFIVNYATSPLQYNHDASIAFYRGQFYAAWNANTVRFEGVGGQRNYLATSTDGINWSEPVPFSLSTSSTQWQPNLLNYNNDESLWCLWTAQPYTYFSKLTDPNDQWSHTPVIEKITVDSVVFNTFASQNPVVLRRGRVLQPITFTEMTSGDWYARKKYCGVIYTDDAGQTWHFDPTSLVANPVDPGHIWESMYVQQYDGNVRMFARNDTPDPPAQDEALITALGDSYGLNFGPGSFSSIRTVVSRCWVADVGPRKLMLHHDYAPTTFTTSRLNIALFSSRSGLDDFVAGVPVINDERQVMYPQACVHGNKMYVVYSQSWSPRNMKCAIVDPVPNADKYYVFPRAAHRRLTNNDPPLTEACIQHIASGETNYLCFSGNAAAGLDIDIVDPCTATLTLVIPVFVESCSPGATLRFLCIGDGQIQLGYDNSEPNQFRILIDGIWYDAGPFAPDAWNTVIITVNKDSIVTYNMGQSVSHNPASSFSGRVYLGDGYPEDFLDNSTRFIIDVKQLGSRVSPTGQNGTCGDSAHQFTKGDLNLDCVTNLDDLAELLDHWLTETD
ncbi:MAG: hypothetical protein ABIG61_07015 [Planctomycetota bacterium]